MNKNIFHLLFELPNGGKLKISKKALIIMKSYAQNRFSDSEAGGIILGRILKDSNDIIIDEVTVPLFGDKRARLSFYRSKEKHQKIINLKWKTSNGTTTYLGEWHTHPELVPNPSVIDVNDWKRRIINDTYAEHLFFIIVGTKEIRCWIGNENIKNPKVLKLLVNT